MIDLHCHILPGVDDGADSMEESLAMAKLAYADGIDIILATPHTLNGVYTNPFSKVSESVAALQGELDRHGIDIKICPGVDAHICAGMLERVREKAAGTVNDNGRYILVEFPPQIITPGAQEELYQLRLNGITPIITHPERNLAIQNTMQILVDFVEMGCLVQITAMSVTGEFGEEAMTVSHQILERRLAHIIASDAHSPNHRPPILSRAVETAADILGDWQEAEAMVEDTAEAILAGKIVEIPEIREIKKKRWWQIF